MTQQDVRTNDDLYGVIFYDLNEQTAHQAPDEPGEIYVFDNQKNVQNTKFESSSIRKELLKMMDNNTTGIRVAWKTGFNF